jgi:hypothetical protein
LLPPAIVAGVERTGTPYSRTVGERWSSGELAWALTRVLGSADGGGFPRVASV